MRPARKCGSIWRFAPITSLLDWLQASLRQVEDSTKIILTTGSMFAFMQRQHGYDNDLGCKHNNSQRFTRADKSGLCQVETGASSFEFNNNRARSKQVRPQLAPGNRWTLCRSHDSESHVIIVMRVRLAKLWRPARSSWWLQSKQSRPPSMVACRHRAV